MQQNVVVQFVDKRKPQGRLVEQRQTGYGRYRGVIRVYRGGPPVDRRVVQPELQRRV